MQYVPHKIERCSDVILLECHTSCSIFHEWTRVSSEFDCSDLTSYFNLFLGAAPRFEALGVIYKISYDFLMRLSQVYHKINIG